MFGGIYTSAHNPAILFNPYRRGATIPINSYNPYFFPKYPYNYVPYILNNLQSE